jgi:NAD(P)-dependent dehydrogenase (short-subunit alcohol dehydrogenase family)
VRERRDQQRQVRRVALVTGANRGIGEALARQLAAPEHDHVVVLGCRDLAGGEAVAHAIGRDAWAQALDVVDHRSIERAVATVLDREGRIDVLVNNAAGHYDLGVAAPDVTAADLRDALETNLIGPWELARAVLPTMLAAGYGRIVNVSSRSGTFSATWSNAPAYATSKAALNMFTLHLANTLTGTGVLVNAYCPGWVRTRMGGTEAPVSPEVAAITGVMLATLPVGSTTTGTMFAEGEPHAW